jgi:L-alanine-DL-glutamate epimerase-like enolase superfamily enzyme
VAAIVDRLVTPHLVDQKAADIPAFRERFIRANTMVVRTGLGGRALGPVDVALWDIGAQRERLPLHRCLGSEAAPEPVIVVAAYPVAEKTPEEIAAAVLEHAAQGYRLLKIARSGDGTFMRRWLEKIAAALPPASRVIVVQDARGRMRTGCSERCRPGPRASLHGQRTRSCQRTWTAW